MKKIKRKSKPLLYTQSAIWFEEWWKKHGLKLWKESDSIRELLWEAWKAGRDEL